MATLRLLVILSLLFIHLGVVQLNDVHEQVGRRISNVMAARDKGFHIASTLSAPRTSHVRKDDHQRDNGGLSAVATIPSKLKPLKDLKHSKTGQATSIRSPVPRFFAVCTISGWILCADGLKCFPEYYRCDGYYDCDDASDEFHSQCDNCTADHLFTCQKDGVDVCLNTKFECDDNSHGWADEELSECGDKFTCSNDSKCISESYRCDGDNDCEDASDESVSLCTPPCPAGMFTCADGLKCLPKWKVKNCADDCADGSDETPAVPCFECADGLQSVKKSYKCDNYLDCEDGSDETLAAQCFICANGLTAPIFNVCDNVYHCDDASDEYESLCTPPCSADMFACADGSKCIPKSKLCDGNGDYGCDDLSNNNASRCNNCADDHLFKCQKSGIDVCLDSRIKCDGEFHCDDYGDELLSQCPNCLNDPAKSKFTCSVGGQMLCLSKKYQCNGALNCDDGSDEDPFVCDNCTQSHDFGHDLAMCRDGSRCFRAKHACNGHVSCNDGSDESDSYSGCKFCTEEGYVPCPGFPGNCAKLCDGRAQCPDHWDELLSTCTSSLAKSNQTEAPICKSKEPRLSPCDDGSMCLSTAIWPAGQKCNAYKDCADGSDESSFSCNNTCQHFLSTFTPVLLCDSGSCIRLDMACSAQKEPLCKDGSDMADNLCEGKCYTLFPRVEDPYRWPCRDGIKKKCILHTSRCDRVDDCGDGTELILSSDERDCHPVTRIGLYETILLCLVIVALSWILFFALIACGCSLDQNKPSHDIETFPHSMLEPPSPLSTPNQAVPSFLLHPALSDIEGQGWNWQEVGEQLRLEVVFFNRNPQVLFDFLCKIEAQNAHPESVYDAFNSFHRYLTSRGYEPSVVAFRMRQAIGHHKLAHMALKGPPNLIEKKVYEIKKWLEGLKTYSEVCCSLLIFLRAIQTSISPFLFNLDYVKDLALYLILRETLIRIEENCSRGVECLAASSTEHGIVTALLITLCVSIILTSINSFFLRKRFFKTSHWLDLVLAFMSPLLPAIYHIQLSQMRTKHDKGKRGLDGKALLRTTKNIETLSNSVQQTKEIEVGLEAIMQILLLIGLACSAPYVFKAPSGQTYSYFFGVALLVLKGNRELFVASVLVSFFGPCLFYINRANVLRHGSLNMSRKLVLMARNVLFLLVRVFAITSAIFIPVITSWDVFIKNQGIDASDSLDSLEFSIEFEKYFSKGLDSLAVEIRKNMQLFGLFLAVHLMLVASHAIFRSAKFGRSMMRERLIYLVSSFWLPLPFHTIGGVDRGEEKAELWFLVALHSLENFLLVLASRLVYLQESYPLGIVVFDCSLACLNLLGVFVSVFYVKKIELYAGLPADLPSSLPSFGPEVRFKYLIWALESIIQDIVNGSISRNENHTVNKMEMELDAALVDMAPLTKVVLSTGEIENVNDEEVEQKGLDALSSNSPSTRKSVPLLKV